MSHCRRAVCCVLDLLLSSGDPTIFSSPSLTSLSPDPEQGVCWELSQLPKLRPGAQPSSLLPDSVLPTCARFPAQSSRRIRNRRTGSQQLCNFVLLCWLPGSLQVFEPRGPGDWFHADVQLSRVVSLSSPPQLLSEWNGVDIKIHLPQHPCYLQLKIPDRIGIGHSSAWSSCVT